jgi:hypothetical protein
MRNFTVFLAVALAAWSGCFHTSGSDAKGGRANDDGESSDGDTASDESDAICARTGALEAIENVDILLVIDNSGSMADEQDAIAAQLPNLVGALAAGKVATTDKNGVKSSVEFPAARSVHVGLVSTDLGVGEVSGEIPSCTRDGDNAKLFPHAAQCGDASKRFLSYEKGESAETIESDLACLVNVGTNGCGLEQQLEATWKALAPSSNTSFAYASAGQGDTRNAGFLRDDSLLVVIVVSDEEDCSIPDDSRDMYELNPTDPRFFGEDGKVQGLNARCGLHADDGVLHPVARYIEGLKSLRTKRPDRLVFAAITGIPSEANQMYENGVQSFDDILALDAMQIRFDGPTTGVIAPLPNPACSSATSIATPARRLVQVAKSFGQNGIVRSICASDFGFSLEMNSVSTQIAKALKRASETPACD